MHLLFPLLSSLLYVAGILFIKRCSDFQVGIWRTTFIANTLTAVLFSFLLFLDGSLPPGQQLWKPFITALLFIAGQILSFVAVEKGDVSVATPVMGIKILLVAFFSVLLLAESVSLRLWVAAFLATAGIVFLHLGPSQTSHPIGRTVLISVLAALAFAIFDVLVQKWSPQFGPGGFLPVMMWIVAALSIGFIPLFKKPLNTISRAAWTPLFWGSLFIGLQAIVLITTLAVYGDATAVNVVYSLRGLWSLAAVWFIGHWFKNREKQQGAAVFRFRLIGALLLSTAVILVLL
ncbi:MAG: DMT family transporter [Verrucomicrobiota bacterium]